MLKKVFADMQAAEDCILATRSVGLNVVNMRVTILSDTEDYFKDYVPGAKRDYTNTCVTVLAMMRSKSSLLVSSLFHNRPAARGGGISERVRVKVSMFEA